MTRAAAKPQSRFVCQSCGEAFLRWEGQCRSCGSWNSLVETVIREPRRAASSGAASALAAESAPLASVPEPRVPRHPFGIAELDRVLGGGIVVGSIVLLGGEPGIGKSTLLLQAAAGICATGGATVLYATGEESAAQVRLRADRLGLLAGPAGTAIRVAAESEVGRITELARTDRPTILIVDSIQTSTVDELDGPAGSVGQVRESALRLAELAKSESIAVVLVGHVTKDGSLAGPKTLEHLVDAVLALEGERFAPLRIVRASKNRFGSTEEVGVFEMGATGLAELDDPARAFLSGGATAGAGGSADERAAPGSVVAPTLEGSRPILVEVQALVAPGPSGRRAEPRTASTPTGWRCSSRSSAGGPGSAWRATTSTSTSPAACRSRSRRSTCRSRWRSRPRCATGRSRPAPSRSARWACSASCDRSRGSTGGCARRPAWGSRGRSCPARRTGRIDRGPSRGSPWSVSTRCARPSRRRSDRPPDA